MDRYTLLYLKWITNKNLLYSTWNSAQYCVAAWMGAEFGRERICVYGESLCCPPETVTTSLIDCMPIQNTKFNFKKERH